jgi:hypothetical protein
MAGAGSSGVGVHGSLGRRHRCYALMALLMVGMVVLRVARHMMEGAYRAEVDRRPAGPYGGTYTIRWVFG